MRSAQSKSQTDVIDFLSRPDSYPLHSDKVDRLETHISFIFLAGQMAYKLKRAISLPFLDFSTTELRRKACLNELRVNRRSAPQIYEDVVPITRNSIGNLEIAGQGIAVDWIVRMRRFDQDMLYDKMAVEGRLPLETMDPLAGAISSLHSAADRVLTRDRSLEALARVITENGEAMCGRRDIYDSSATSDLTGMSREYLERLRPLLRQREQGGCVRHCHGDLHLRNIVGIAGKPVLFDAIEFDDDVATVDVLHDLAFLLMDLWRRNLKRHANSVFNSYLGLDAGTGHLPGLAALPLYLSVRAMIRSKVEALRDDGAAEAHQAALDYFALARAFLRPAPALLCGIGGLSGTGKSTVALGVAGEVGAAPGAVVLRSDVERKKLFGVALATKLGPEAYAADITATVYGVLRKKAAFALDAGHSVIVDAVHGNMEERAALESIASERGVRFKGIWLEAPQAVLLSRVAARRNDASDADAAVVKEQIGRETGAMAWARIDAGRDMEMTRRAVARLLAAD